MIAELCFAAAALLALVGLGWWVLDQPPCVRQRVIVNLKSDPDTALSGVLWSSRGPWLVLRAVVALKSDRQPVPVDGESVIHRQNVHFLQVVR